MAKLEMLCGLPGSGKTHYAKTIQRTRGATVVSSDDIRKELCITDYKQKSNRKVFSVVNERVKNALMNDEYVIYDATNINASLRNQFLQDIKDIRCIKEITVFAVPFEKCLRNNWMRKDKIQDEVIKRMYMNWQTPVYHEGWHWISVRQGVENDCICEFWESIKDYKLDNETLLSEHLDKTQWYVKEITDADDLILAAKYHDCGKPFCRIVFDDLTGVPIYSNYENVGAYDALSRYNLPLETSALINYQSVLDECLNDDGSVYDERTYELIQDVFGKTFTEKLKILYLADLNS